jgi:O-antigen/teichoic acid export membrane protein
MRPVWNTSYLANSHSRSPLAELGARRERGRRRVLPGVHDGDRRVIGPHATGVGTIAIAAFLIMEVFGAVLFPDALVQLPGLTRRHSDSAVTAAVLVGVVLGLGLAAAAPLLAAGAGAPEVTWLILAVAPLVPVSAFSGTVSGLLLREQRFRLLSLRLLLGQPLALTAGLVLASHGYGPWAMIVNQVVATSVTFLVMLGDRSGLRPRLDPGALRDLWPVAGPQMAGVAVNIGRYRIFYQIPERLTQRGIPLVAWV